MYVHISIFAHAAQALALCLHGFANERALTSPACAMVVAARLDWMKLCITNGMHVRLAISPAAYPSKCKITATVEPSRPRLQDAAKSTMLQMLDAITAACALHVVVDRGHKHSSSNSSEVAFWLTLPAAGAGATRTDKGDDDTDKDEDDDAGSNGGHRGAGKRRHNHEGPDPWHDGTGTDPWAGCNASPVRKVGRTHTSVVDASSTTNDGVEESSDTSSIFGELSNLPGDGKSCQSDIMIKKIDLLLAGMALAIGPGFVELTKQFEEEGVTSESAHMRRPDQKPLVEASDSSWGTEPQPEDEPSPAPAKMLKQVSIPNIAEGSVALPSMVEASVSPDGVDTCRTLKFDIFDTEDIGDDMSGSQQNAVASAPDHAYEDGPNDTVLEPLLLAWQLLPNEERRRQPLCVDAS